MTASGHEQSTRAEPVVVGDGEFRYRVDESWPRLPPEWDLVETAATATDSAGRVYVFNRGEHSVCVFDTDGELLQSWGEGLFTRAHGLTIGPDDAVYCTDDLDHTIKKFTTNGKLLQTFGTSGVHSDTGATTVDYRNIRRSGPPFNFPTNVALAANGDLYITDGYGNARVHHFSPEGQLLGSWGDPGDEPGQFHVPHGIALDKAGIVYVADRENDRIQRFAPDGEYIDEWNDLARPAEVFIDPGGTVYVAELGYRAGRWPGTGAAPPGATGGRMSIFTADGKLVARWGGGENPCAPGDFFAPHDVWVDGCGDLYVSEVTMSAGGNDGLVPPDCHSVQRFVRIRESEQP